MSAVRTGTRLILKGCNYYAGPLVWRCVFHNATSADCEHNEHVRVGFYLGAPKSPTNLKLSQQPHAHLQCT